MIRVSGTTNQIPIKSSSVGDFIPLLKDKKISYRFVGSMIGYFFYEFESEADQKKAAKLRDSLYKSHKL